MGLRRVYQARHDCRVRVDLTRQRSRSWGLFGGGAGAHGKVEAGPGVVFEGDSAVLKTGQWFALVTPGAGGFGPPDRRERAAAARDLAEGAISLRVAATSTVYDSPAKALRLHAFHPLGLTVFYLEAGAVAANAGCVPVSNPRSKQIRFQRLNVGSKGYANRREVRFACLSTVTSESLRPVEVHCQLYVHSHARLPRNTISVLEGERARRNNLFPSSMECGVAS